MADKSRVVHGHCRLPRNYAHCVSRTERRLRREKHRAEQAAHNMR